MLNKAVRHWISGIVGVAALLGVAVSPEVAEAQQQNCGQRERVVKMLQIRHAEAPISMGLAANGAIVEVFSTADGASWTLLMTMPDGRTCLMASGESWVLATRVAGQVS